MTSAQIDAALNIAGLLALVTAWFGIVRPAMSDLFRQRIFVLRDGLFDFMLDAPDVSPGDPAYRISRDWMNAMIRLSDRMDVPTLLLHIARLRSARVRTNVSRCFRHLEKDYDAETKEKLGSYLAKAVGQFLLFVCLRSVLTMIVIGFLLITVSLFKKLNPRHWLKREVLQVLDHEALQGRGAA